MTKGKNEGRLFGGFRMHKSCPECGHGVAMNGPQGAYACDYCGTVVDVSENLDAALERFWNDEYGVRAEGRTYTFGRGGKLTIAGFVEYREGEPRCRKCGGSLPVVAPGTDASLTCGGCGEGYETFPPPPEIAGRIPYLIQCYGAERPIEVVEPGKGEAGVAGELGTEGKAAVAPSVLLGCPECGATSTAGEDTPRATVCEYCKAHVFLPDAVWEHLHTVRRKRRWFVEMSRKPAAPPEGQAAGKDRDEEHVTTIDEDREVFLAHRKWLEERGALKPAGSGVFGRFRLHVVCPMCGSEVPVNGPVMTATCGKCSAEVNVAARVGGWIREFEFSTWALPEEDRKCTFAGSVLNAIAHYQTSKPRCPGCGAEIARVETGTDGETACAGCGRAIPVFPAPAWLREHALSAAQCYACERDIDATGADQTRARDLAAAAGAGVVFPCLACGASMEIGQGSARICTCPYCGRNMHVPDAVWFRLHPPREEMDWYLELGGPLVTERGEAARVAEDVERDVQERRNREALRIYARRERAERMASIRKNLVWVVLGVVAAAALAAAWIIWL